MTELTFQPGSGLRKRAEIRAEDAGGDQLASRVARKVDTAVADANGAAPHPRLTRGTHLDELHAVEESVDRQLGEVAWITAQMRRAEDEIQHLRTLYRRLILAGAVVAAVIVLVLLIVVLTRR